MTETEASHHQIQNPELIFRLTPKNPTANETSRIDEGSGIVARIINPESTNPYASIYFEGNRFGAVNLKTLHERERCAAGRLHTQYPTVARTSLPLAQATQLFEFEIPEVSLVPQIRPTPPGYLIYRAR